MLVEHNASQKLQRLLKILNFLMTSWVYIFIPYFFICGPIRSSIAYLLKSLDGRIYSSVYLISIFKIR